MSIVLAYTVLSKIYKQNVFDFSSKQICFHYKEEKKLEKIQKHLDSSRLCISLKKFILILHVRFNMLQISFWMKVDKYRKCITYNHTRRDWLMID